eukprot:scaffold432_cov345-Prasinococcus_capsulatus_cf.AAC.6
MERAVGLDEGGLGRSGALRHGLGVHVLARRAIDIGLVDGRMRERAAAGAHLYGALTSTSVRPQTPAEQPV